MQPVRIQTSCAEPATLPGVLPIPCVRSTRALRGSIRDTVSLLRLSTQSRPAPATIGPGASSTWSARVTVFVRGSITATESTGTRTDSPASSSPLPSVSTTTVTTTARRTRAAAAAGHRRRPRGGCRLSSTVCCRLRRVEAGILVEHLLVQRPQLGAGLDPELAHEDLPQLGWWPAARSASSRSSIALQPLLLELGDLVGRERLVGEVGKRRAPPQPQRLAQNGASLLGLACRERLTALRHQALEPLRVELALPHPEPVARPARDDQVRIVERLAQPRDVALHPLPRAGRRVLAPQRERQLLGADRLVGVQDEHGQQRARLDAAERHRMVFGTHLERTEDRELHRWQSGP